MEDSMHDMDYEQNIPPFDDATDSIMQIRQKYKNPALLILYELNRILHAELANLLDVSPSGLNAIIKKINETDKKPIHDIKAGKFKFYQLSEEGKIYVTTVILPTIVGSSEDEEDLHKILNLLFDFKKNNKEIWNDKLKQMLEENHITDDMVNEFLQQFSRYYRRWNDKAQRLLELSISDKTVRQKIIDFVESNAGYNGNSAIAILEHWDKQNCELLYHFIDEAFDNIETDREIDLSLYEELLNISSCAEMVLSKIKADILPAIVQGWNKDRLLELWIDAGMDKHLALYLSEKFRILYVNLFNERR